MQHRLAIALGEQATVPSGALRFGSGTMLLGRELAESLGWRELILVRLTESEGELLGVLCLVDLGRELSATECQLLEALASHASVALENVRLFSRSSVRASSGSRISTPSTDFIVVHDHAARVLRLNRALADLLKMAPAEAVGRDIGKLELLASPAQPGRCPFCRNARRGARGIRPRRG